MTFQEQIQNYRNTENILYEFNGKEAIHIATLCSFDDVDDSFAISWLSDFSDQEKENAFTILYKIPNNEFHELYELRYRIWIGDEDNPDKSVCGERHVNEKKARMDNLKKYLQIDSL